MGGIKMEGSKELNNIFEAIQKWMKKHEGKVEFFGSFMAFKGKDFDIVDNRLLAFGLKESIRTGLKDMDEEIEKEKEEFVNW